MIIFQLFSIVWFNIFGTRSLKESILKSAISFKESGKVLPVNYNDHSFIHFFSKFIEIILIYNIVLVPDIQQHNWIIGCLYIL